MCYSVILFTFRQLKKTLKGPLKRSTRILQDPSLRDPLKIGILGCGRLGSQLAYSFMTFGNVLPEDIKVSTRRPETLGTVILVIVLRYRTAELSLSTG